MQTLQSIQSIFKDRIFKIPDYQRGYAWQEKQLKDFWEDIINLPNDRFHYTGVLSLEQVKREKYEAENWANERWLIKERASKPYYIVDGQQRLTTIVIFINELLNLVKSIPKNIEKTDTEILIGSFKLNEIKEEYIVIRERQNNIINTYKFGYEKDNPSFLYLKHKIFGEPDSGNITETFYTLNLENARDFFKENLEEFYNNYSLEEVELLFKKVTQNLMFNLHEIEEDFDVFVAFETMNNRGKKLSNLELLKNRLIYLTTLYDDEINDDERIVLREDINTAWRDIYYQLGRNKQHPLSDDDFLTAHWIIYFQYTRQKGDDYIKFLLGEKFTPQNIFKKIEVSLSSMKVIEEVRDKQEDEDEIEEDGIEEKTIKRSKLAPIEISDYVKSLQSTAKHWYNSFNPLNNSDLTKNEQLWLDRLNRIGIAYFRPLVVASYCREDITTESRVRLFKEIERFIFLAFRIGRAFSTYRNSEYYRLTKQLRIGEVSVSDICNSLRNRIENWLSPETAFDIQSFKAYIGRHYKNGGGFYWWNGLHYFLYEYEQEKVLQNGNQKIEWYKFVKSERDKVSIEHIYPQKPDNEYWEKAFADFSEEQKKYLTGSLGNLLPLSRSKNSSMQNDSFPDKKSPSGKAHTGYKDGSHSEIEVASYEDWNADSIYDRGKKLIKFMESRWNIKFANDGDEKAMLFLDFLE